MVAKQLKKLAVTGLITAQILCFLTSTISAQETAPSASEANGLPIRVLADDAYFPTLIKLLESADSSVDLVMFVFKVGKRKNNRPAKIRDALIRAAQRGIKVRVFLERSGYDEKLNDTNSKVAEQLIAGGVRVIFESPKTTTHNKMVLVDRRYAIVGSHNLTQSALKYNHELSLLVDDRELAEKLLSYLENSIRP